MAEKPLWSLLHRYHSRVLEFDSDLDEYSQKHFRECLLAEVAARQPPSKGKDEGDAPSRSAEEWKGLFESWKRDRRLTQERSNLDLLFAEILERLKKDETSSSPLQHHGIQALVERLIIIAKESKEGVMPAAEEPDSAVDHFFREGEVASYAEIDQLLRMIDEQRMTLEYLQEHLEVITGGEIPIRCVEAAKRRMRRR